MQFIMTGIRETFVCSEGGTVMVANLSCGFEPMPEAEFDVIHNWGRSSSGRALA